MTLVLGRTEDVVIAMAGAAVYPSGCELRLTVRSRRLAPEFLSGLRSRFGSPESGLQIGVQFADGSRTKFPLPVPEAGVRLSPYLGTLAADHGGTGGLDLPLWLWPFPPPGPVTLYARWAELGLDESSVVLDGELLQTAAEQASVLWTVPSPARESESDATLTFGDDVSVTTAAAAIKAAYDSAFGAIAAADLHRVVQHGELLVPALEEARARFPGGVGMVWVAISDVTLVDEASATLNLVLHYQGGSPLGEQRAAAVLEDGMWKVAFETFARTIGAAGVSLPAAPPPGRGHV